MDAVNICPKCKARMIDEEADTHECDIPLRVDVEGGYLMLRSHDGFWRRFPVSERFKQNVGEVPAELSWDGMRHPNWDRPRRHPEYGTEPTKAFSMLL